MAATRAPKHAAELAELQLLVKSFEGDKQAYSAISKRIAKFSIVVDQVKLTDPQLVDELFALSAEFEKKREDSRPKDEKETKATSAVYNNEEVIVRRMIFDTVNTALNRNALPRLIQYSNNPKNSEKKCEIARTVSKAIAEANQILEDVRVDKDTPTLDELSACIAKLLLALKTGIVAAAEVRVKEAKKSSEHEIKEMKVEDVTKFSQRGFWGKIRGSAKPDIRGIIEPAYKAVDEADKHITAAINKVRRRSIS